MESITTKQKIIKDLIGTTIIPPTPCLECLICTVCSSPCDIVLRWTLIDLSFKKIEHHEEYIRYLLYNREITVGTISPAQRGPFVYIYGKRTLNFEDEGIILLSDKIKNELWPNLKVEERGN